MPAVLSQGPSSVEQNYLLDNLEAALLDRVIHLPGGSALPPRVTTTPEYPGVVALLDDNLRSSTSKPLPHVEEMIALREHWLRSSTPLGELVDKTTISTTTGCWIKMSAKSKDEEVPQWRNSEGYVVIKNPHRFGLPKRSDEEEKRGMLFHRLTPTLLCIELGIEPILGRKKDKDGEHDCRNKACGNPYHLIAVTNRENNLLRLKAEKVEKALVSGQMIMGALGVEWVDARVEEAEQEDTGLVFTTKDGPFRLMKASDDPVVMYAQREPDDVFDSLRKPARSHRNFKSRARRRKPIEGQEGLFSPLKYRKYRKLTPKDRYKKTIKSGKAA